MMIEDLQRQRILAGDGQIKHLAIARRRLGDVLQLEFLQIRFARLPFAHGVKNRANEDVGAPEPRLVDHIIFPSSAG